MQRQQYSIRKYKYHCNIFISFDSCLQGITNKQSSAILIKQNKYIPKMHKYQLYARGLSMQ